MMSIDWKFKKHASFLASLDYPVTKVDHSPNAVVIGYGMAGKSFHSYLVNLVDNLNLYGIVARSDKTQQKVQQDLPSVKVFKTLDEALSSPRVDLIIVASSTDVHYEQCLQALKAGKHVVCDKPVCVKLTEFDALCQVAKSNSVLFTVFHNRRFDGDYLTTKKVIEDGKLGEVRWIEMAYRAGKSGKRWKQLPPEKGGGRFFDLASHLTDQILQLFPDPVKNVYARMHFDYPECPGMDSHALEIITFESGRTGIMDTATMATVDKPRFYIVGELGTFCKFGFDPQEDAMFAGDIDAAEESKDDYGEITYQNGKTETIPTIQGRWRNYYENIAEVLTLGVKPLVSLQSVRRTVEVLEAALRSGREQHDIKVVISAL